ncbi:MAG: Smr/MutS family protein [Deltaproteobacteria bacterium]|jgi:DNA mismatch repair protein MutS2|nr:Smr/MutS family protein [Deltaproteobacteria bacterium]
MRKTRLHAVQEIIEIDFHGWTVAESLARLDEVLDRAILSDVRQINIIHGLGTGKIKNAVHLYLQNSKYISRFELSPVNPGVTVVYL